MSTFYQQQRSLALEEPSEGRTTAKAFREAARNQSPQNPMRQSTTSTGNQSVASPPQARGSANGELTVDSLLDKVQGLLDQTQNRRAQQQANLQARQPGLGYSQPRPLSPGPSSGTTVTPPNGQRSITPENRTKKNEIFVKKSYDNPLWNSEPLVINSVKESMTPKSMARNTEMLFPIRESLNASTTSTAPRNSEKAKSSAPPPGNTNAAPYIPLNSNVPSKTNLNQDIHGTMDDLYSRLNNLEKHLNSINTPKMGNNNAYETPRSQSIPPSKTGSLFTTPVPQYQQEAPKKSFSPYGARDRPSSVERERPFSPETNPKHDAEISEKICQTIDKLIETHMTRHRSPGRSPVLSQRNFYTSPSKDLYSPADANPLYKSSITEPVHKSTPYSNTYSSPKYEPYEPSSSKYEPYDSRSTYDKYESKYQPYEPATSKYEPYEPRSYDPLPASKYESQYNYEPRRDNSYENRPYESRYNRDYEPYEPKSNYDRDYRTAPNNNTSYSYLPDDLDGSYSRSRQRYVRPLWRNSPQRYPTESNYSTSNVDNYRSPRDNYRSPRDDYVRNDYPTKNDYNYKPDYSNLDYLNRPIYSVNATPSKENPHHNDVNSTDKKLKKLTLKSKVSEEKDSHEPKKKENRSPYKAGELLSDNEGDALPLPSVERAPTVHSKKSHKVKATPVPEDHGYQHGDVKISTYKAGKLQNDDSFNAGDLIQDGTPRYQTGELVDDSQCSWGEKECEMEDDREEENERAKEKARKEERERVRKEAERQRLRQSRIAKDVADDGKSWNMVHKLPSQVFEEENSGFDFTQPQPTPKVNKKVTVQAKPKQATQPSSKAMVWTMDESVDVSRRGSMSNLSDSIRRSQRKPVITHAFEKSDRLGY